MHRSRYWLSSFIKKNLNKYFPKLYFNPPKLVLNLLKVNNKKASFVVFIANFEQTSYFPHASIAYFVHIITCWAHMVKLLMIQRSDDIWTKRYRYYILNYLRKNFLITLSKFLKSICDTVHSK